jgi:hypothetical protein
MLAIRLKLPVRESRGDLRTTLLNDVVVLGYAGRGVLGALPQEPSQDELYAYRVFYTADCLATSRGDAGSVLASCENVTDCDCHRARRVDCEALTRKAHP